MDTFREILSRLPLSVRQELEVLPDYVVSETEEIRLRCGQHIRLQSKNMDRIVSHVVTAEELVKTLNSLIKYSYYAYEEDLAKGFVTIEGGHRVGICGKAVVQKLSCLCKQLIFIGIAQQSSHKRLTVPFGGHGGTISRFIGIRIFQPRAALICAD